MAKVCLAWRNLSEMVGLLLVLLLTTCQAVELDKVDLHPEGGALCTLGVCSCKPSPSQPHLLHVSCACDGRKAEPVQHLDLGMEERSPGSFHPPTNAGSLVIEDCERVELHSRLLNSLGQLQNLTVRNAGKLVIQGNLYEARGRSREMGANITNVDITNIDKLEVKRFAFRDLEVTNRFYLGEVNVNTVVSMAFTFSSVKEFSVFASKFDRISMFGVKLSRCREFNVLGMTHFGSLAAHAIKVSCDKFSLAYNWFGRLHDSSFEVEYGLCDIQGNTFNSLGGKPFLALQPLPPEQVSGPNEIAMSGLVFRENKFAAEPLLPFASLAMPAFDRLSPETSYIDIEGNQFPCRCQSVGWLLAFGEFGLNKRSLSEVGSKHGSGTVSFLNLLYSSAGACIHCDHRDCRVRGEPRGLGEYAQSALLKTETGAVQCGARGLEVQDYDSMESPGGGAGGLQPQPWRKDAAQSSPSSPSSSSSSSSSASSLSSSPSSSPSNAPSNDVTDKAESLSSVPISVMILLHIVGQTL